MASDRLGQAERVTYRRRALSWLAAVAGFIGAALCSGSMVLGALGVAGAAAAGAGGATDMESMGSTSGRLSPLDAVIQFLITWGPPILVGSIVLFVVFAVAAGRRPLPVVLAAAAGTLLYWGMYVQSSPAVMYGSIAAGMSAWVALLLLVVRTRGAVVGRRVATRESQGGNVR